MLDGTTIYRARRAASRHHGLAALIAMLLAWVLCASAALAAERPAAAPVSASTSSALALTYELQQRQLHRLAEIHCRQQLQRAERAGGDVSPWIRGLLESLTGRALAEDNLDDETLWAEADRQAAEYERRLGETESGFAVALQRQMVHLAHADACLLAAMRDGDPEPRRRQARELLRGAARSLEELDKRIAQLLRSPPVRDDAEQTGAIQVLQQQVRFAIGTVFLRHAAAYSDRSPDRVHLLTEAQRSFSDLARRVPTSELTIESRLREIECLRQLHSYEVARQRLAQFPTEDLSPAIREQLALEQARLEMDQGNLQQAVQKLLAAQQLNQQSGDRQRRGELMLALVEVYLELAKQDGSSLDSAESQQWHDLALDVIRQMEEQVSAYWVRRAETMLAMQPTAAAGITELEIMSRAADNFFRREQFEESLAAYQRAAQLAAELQLPSRQFTLGLRAAAVQQQLGRHEPAGEAFRQLANRFPQHEQAAQAHWLAIASEAETARKDPSRLPVYRQLLEEHLQNWPQSQWVDDARYWLGRLLLQQNDEAGAQRYWLAISAESARLDEAMRAMRAHYQQRLSELADGRGDRNRVAQEAMAIMRQWYESTRSVVRAEGLPASEALLSIAEIGILFGGMSVDEAQEVTSPLASELRDEPALMNRLLALHGLYGALAEDVPGAERAWSQVDWQTYELALPLARRLHEALRGSSRFDPLQTTRAPTELARLQRDLTSRLLRVDTCRNHAPLQIWNAVALAAGGERAAAIERLEHLAAQSPPDVEVERRLAELYETGERADDQRRALDHWRRVVRLAPSGSEIWFYGKLGIARRLAQLDQRQRAAETIAVLQALHPELGGPELKAKFLELHSQLKEPSPAGERR